MKGSVAKKPVVSGAKGEGSAQAAQAVPQAPIRPVVPRRSLANLPITPPVPHRFKGGDRSEIRHGGLEPLAAKIVSDARAKLHEQWEVPPTRQGQKEVGLPRGVLGDEEEMTVPERMAKLPSAYREGEQRPHIERLLNEPDPAHQKYYGVMSNAAPASAEPMVTGGRMREVLAGLEYAKQSGIPLGEVSSGNGHYDFDAGADKIDPFEIPDAQYPKTVRKFFKDDEAYQHHTLEKKGKGVIGVLDATYSHPDDIDAMFAGKPGNPAERRVDLRVPLEHEYLRDAVDPQLAANPRYQSLLRHRGSDPTRKFGISTPEKRAANKARYDKAKAEKERRRGGGL